MSELKIEKYHEKNKDIDGVYIFFTDIDLWISSRKQD